MKKKPITVEQAVRNISEGIRTDQEREAERIGPITLYEQRDKARRAAALGYESVQNARCAVQHALAMSGAVSERNAHMLLTQSLAFILRDMGEVEARVLAAVKGE